MMESSITASITCGEMVWSTTEKLGKKKTFSTHGPHPLCFDLSVAKVKNEPLSSK